MKSEYGMNIRMAGIQEWILDWRERNKFTNCTVLAILFTLDDNVHRSMAVSVQLAGWVHFFFFVGQDAAIVPLNIQLELKRRDKYALDGAPQFVGVGWTKYFANVDRPIPKITGLSLSLSHSHRSTFPVSFPFPLHPLLTPTPPPCRHRSVST